MSLQSQPHRLTGHWWAIGLRGAVAALFGLAALVRVALEFFMAMFLFVREFQELILLARSLESSMKTLDVPMSNVGGLAGDLRALQFWRRAAETPPPPDPEPN